MNNHKSALQPCLFLLCRIGGGWPAVLLALVSRQAQCIAPAPNRRLSRPCCCAQLKQELSIGRDTTHSVRPSSSTRSHPTIDCMRRQILACEWQMASDQSLMYTLRHASTHWSKDNLCQRQGDKMDQCLCVYRVCWSSGEAGRMRMRT